jgi:hypothetical protein
VDQVTCAKGNVVHSQAQGDDAEYPMLEKTNTESPWHVSVDITDGNTIIESLPYRIFSRGRRKMEMWQRHMRYIGS